VLVELNPEAYDVSGHRVFSLSRRLRRKFPSTAPMGRYLSHPLVQRFDNLEALRQWLRGCRYVSDEEQFGRDDFWMPPEEFEAARKGDCEDFALWTWRQLMNMGLEARFVGGRAGRYGDGHAWVVFADGGRHYLVEPLAAHVGPSLPRLSALRYDPAVSAGWDGAKVKLFAHEKPQFEVRFSELPGLVLEWLRIYLPVWARFAIRLPASILRKVVGLVRNATGV